jgi:hypothetical protein
MLFQQNFSLWCSARRGKRLSKLAKPATWRRGRPFVIMRPRSSKWDNSSLSIHGIIGNKLSTIYAQARNVLEARVEACEGKSQDEKDLWRFWQCIFGYASLCTTAHNDKSFSTWWLLFPAMYRSLLIELLNAIHVIHHIHCNDCKYAQHACEYEIHNRLSFWTNGIICKKQPTRSSLIR